MLHEDSTTLSDNINNKKYLKLTKNYFEYRKKILIVLKELITLLLIYIGRKLYILSLKGCNGNEFSCLHNINYIYIGMNRCIKSSIIFIINIIFNTNSFFKIL